MYRNFCIRRMYGSILTPSTRNKILFSLAFILLMTKMLIQEKQDNILIPMEDYPKVIIEDKDPWSVLPTMDIFVRMCSKTRDLYENVLIPSMKLFWPNQTSMFIVLDNESKEDHELGEILPKSWPYPKVFYEDPAPEVYHDLGHSRQQWSMFYPDNYTSAEYVAIVDTDTAFITMVTPENLFQDGKPVVIGEYGKFASDLFRSAANMTRNLFGDDFEIMKCMSYFPVIIKVKHIIELRHYLERKYNTTFDEIFKTRVAPKRNYSQFNIMCQYIYFHHRDEYSFHLQLRPNGKWKKQEPARAPMSFYKENFSEKERAPFPRTSIHWKYHFPRERHLAPRRSKGRYFYQALLEGVCHSGGFDLCPKQCIYFKKTALHQNLFHFEYSDWKWDSRCMAAQERHYTNVANLRAYYQRVGRQLFGHETPLVACQMLERHL